MARDLPSSIAARASLGGLVFYPVTTGNPERVPKATNVVVVVVLVEVLVVIDSQY